MRLSEEAITELKEIHRKEFGENLSDDEAAEIGERLLRLFQIIYRPLPSTKDPPANLTPGS